MKVYIAISAFSILSACSALQPAAQEQVEKDQQRQPIKRSVPALEDQKSGAVVDTNRSTPAVPTSMSGVATPSIVQFTKGTLYDLGLQYWVWMSQK